MIFSVDDKGNCGKKRFYHLLYFYKHVFLELIYAQLDLHHSIGGITWKGIGGEAIFIVFLVIVVLLGQLCTSAFVGRFKQILKAIVGEIVELGDVFFEGCRKSVAVLIGARRFYFIM